MMTRQMNDDTSNEWWHVKWMMTLRFFTKTKTFGITLLASADTPHVKNILFIYSFIYLFSILLNAGQAIVQRLMKPT